MASRLFAILTLAALLTCCPTLLPAQSRADAAEAAYRAGEYQKAKDLWSAMLVERGVDGRLEYDIGNCCYRLGDYARALWRYERAARVLGGDERVRFNLALAERKLGLDSRESSSFFADARARVRRLNRGDWFVYGLGLEILGLVLLVVSLRRRSTLWIVFSGLVALVGAAGLVRAATLDADRVLGIIVLEEGTAVRGEPRAELDSILRLGAGVRAEYIAKSPGWVRLRIRDREGWVARENVGLY